MNDNNRGLENGDVPGISHQDDIEQAVMSSKGDVEHILLERISSISELMEWLDQLPEGWIQWSRYRYSSSELKEIIVLVVSGKQHLHTLTRTSGLRDKVNELMTQKGNDINSELINISWVKTWGELSTYLSALPDWWIQWSGMFYPVDLLTDLIQKVIDGSMDIQYITRTYGLRDKIIELRKGQLH